MSSHGAITSALALAIAFALYADVVAEHGPEDEVLFWSKLVQRTGNNKTDGLQTLVSSEVNI